MTLICTIRPIDAQGGSNQPCHVSMHNETWSRAWNDNLTMLDKQNACPKRLLTNFNMSGSNNTWT